LSKWTKPGGYGLLMMETRDRRWYWSYLLMVVEGVARGRRIPGTGRNLKPSENNYDSALHVILTLERSIDV
jgi:hypothetical protein